MPRSNGVYYLPGIYKATPGTTIRADQHNVPMEDVAQALTNSVARDGSADMTGNLKMGGNKVTGLAAGSANGDAVRFGQLGPAATKEKVDIVDDTEGTLPLNRGGTGATDAAGARSALNLGELATGTKDSHRVSNPTNNNNIPWLWSGSDVRAAVSALALGEGQKWYDVSNSRSGGTAYQNTTGRPIQVLIHARSSINSQRILEASEDGSSWITIGTVAESSAGAAIRTGGSPVIPTGWYYRVDGALSSTHTYWAEMR